MAVKDKNDSKVTPFRRPERSDACPYATDPRTDPDFLAEAEKCARELELEDRGFDHLTALLVLEKHRRGELDPGIVAALLAGVGLEVPAEKAGRQ